MNANDHELTLLRLMRSTCEQARQRGSAELAEAAIKHEKRLKAMIEKLEGVRPGAAQEPAVADAA